MTSVQSNCFIGAYWGSRKESLSSCADRLEPFLRELAVLSPDFHNWFQKAASKKEALASPLVFSSDQLAGALARGTNKRDTDGLTIEELGFRLDVWNGDEGSRSVGLNLLCGAADEAVSNACVLKYSKANLDTAFTDASQAVKIITAIVRHWDPDWIAVTSYDVLRLVEKKLGTVRRLLPGWIMYGADRIGGGIKWPRVHSKQRCLDRGDLIILTEHPISADDAEDMERVEKTAQFLQL